MDKQRSGDALRSCVGAAALVVDDDASIRALIAEALAGEGFTVHEAENGRQAVEVLRELTTMALIITDILMPDKDGIEFLIDAKRISHSARIIAISGGGEYADSSFYLESAPHLGAHAALAKPFSISDLLAAVASVGFAMGQGMVEP